MKKSQFVILLLTLILSAFLLNTVNAQAQRTLILKKGNYSTASEIPGGGFGRCFCGQAAFDCLCGFVDLSDFVDAKLANSELGVALTSINIEGNILQIKFQEKLKMELKVNDFIQEKPVLINSKISNSLGFKSIKVLPGKYVIKNGIELDLNIEKSRLYKTRGWGWAVVVIIVIIIWGVIGGSFPSSGPNGSIPTGQGCDFCRQLIIYWNGFSFWQKLKMLVWYIWKKTECIILGC